MTILGKIYNKKIIYRNLYSLIFDTKITIFPHKVRHVLPRQDVCLILTAKYLHIHIPYQNLRKVWTFSVSFLYMLCSCEVFHPVWWPPAWRGSRRFRGTALDSALEGDWTRDKRIKSGLLLVPQSANVWANSMCLKISFFLLFRNLLFIKQGHSAHSEKLLLLGIDLLDHLILNCMELLTSFKSYKEV